MKFRDLLAILLLFFCANSIYAQLNGVYTIDSSGKGSRNFYSIRSAAKNLLDSGISGPVVFNIANGLHHEHVKFGNIKGAGPSSLITFQSACGDSNGVMISYSSVSDTDDYIFDIQGNYFIFRGMSFQNLGKKYSVSINLEIGASDNIIENNVFFGSRNGKGGQEIITWDDKCNSNTFKNNWLKYGYISFSHTSFTKDGVWVSRDSFLNNILDSPQYIGFQLYHQDSSEIKENVLTFSDSGGFAMRYFNTSGSDVFGNIFINGLIDMDEGGTYVFRDNFISNGVIFVNDASTNIYNNNIFMSAPDTGGPLISVYCDCSGGASANISNNNLINKGGGGIIAYGSISWPCKNVSVSASNNNIFANGTYWAANDDTTYTTFKGAEKVLGKSVSIDPQFVSKTNLHIRNDSLDKLAPIYIYDFADIDGDQRPVKACIGADQIKHVDMKPFKLLNPANMSCVDSQLNVQVIVQNFGIDTVKNCEIYYSVNSGTFDSLTVKKNILPFAEDTLSLVVKIKNPVSGTYKFSLVTKVLNDERPDNDTLIKQVNLSMKPNLNFIITNSDSFRRVFRFSPIDSVTSGYTYLWNFSDGTSDTFKYPIHKFSSGGLKKATLVVTASCMCSDSTTKSFMLNNVVTGLNNKDKHGYSISIYPNPANSILYLQTNNNSLARASARVYVSDLSGKTLMNQQIHSQQTSIDVLTLPSGIYLIRYQDNEKVWNGKFEKE